MGGYDIVIIGEGLLADYVHQLLSADFYIHRAQLYEELPKGSQLALLLHDHWNPALYQKANELFRSQRLNWLRGCILLGEGIIGPLVHFDQPGCSQCADVRRLIAGPDRQETWNSRWYNGW